MLIVASAQPASASSAYSSIIQGSGSFSPGLSAVPTEQTFSFAGTETTTGVVDDGAEVLGTHPMTASGTDVIGSSLAGAGTITINVLGSHPATGTFVRVGAVLTYSVTGGPPTVVSVGVCLLVYAQIPPAGVTSYTAVCKGVTVIT
jgi:hypothetical protein